MNFKRIFFSGFSLMELVIVLTLLAVIAGLGIPVAEVMVVREYEKELRLSLKTIRKAIDSYREDQSLRYGDLAPGSYPASLAELVLSSDTMGVHFLRKIPQIPYYGTTNWEVRSAKRGYTGSDADWKMVIATQSNPFGAGHDMLDVRFPKSIGDSNSPFYKAIDGSFYYDW